MIELQGMILTFSWWWERKKTDTDNEKTWHSYKLWKKQMTLLFLFICRCLQSIFPSWHKSMEWFLLLYLFLSLCSLNGIIWWLQVLPCYSVPWEESAWRTHRKDDEGNECWRRITFSLVHLISLVWWWDRRWCTISWDKIMREMMNWSQILARLLYY